MLTVRVEDHNDLSGLREAAAGLKDGDGIWLKGMWCDTTSVDWMRTVLSAPEAAKVHALSLSKSCGDIGSVAHLLVNCPELHTLSVYFFESDLNLVTCALESCPKLRVLEMKQFAYGDVPRFFRALDRSRVEELTMTINDSLELHEGLGRFIEQDRLTKLAVFTNGNVAQSSELMSRLEGCHRLVELVLFSSLHTRPVVFPRNVTTLELCGATFESSVTWPDKVRDLNLFLVKGVDVEQLARVCVLEKLDLNICSFANQVLSCVALGGIQELRIGSCPLTEASMMLIADAVRGGQLTRLILEPNPWERDLAILEPALKHPGCSVAWLTLNRYGPDETQVTGELCLRRCLFALLVKRRGAIRRLPLEMFRLVGQMLL